MLDKLRIMLYICIVNFRNHEQFTIIKESSDY